LHDEQNKEIKTVSTSTPSPVSKERTIKCVYDDALGQSRDIGQVTEKYCKEQMEISKIYKPSTYKPYVFTPFPAYKGNCYVGTQILPNLTTEECTAKQNEFTVNQQEIARLEIEHRDACNQVVAEWRTIVENFWAREANQYGSSSQAASALEGRRQQYESRMRAAGCNQSISIF